MPIDIRTLKEESVYRVEIPVTIMPKIDGDFPILYAEITEKSRRIEIKAFQRYFSGFGRDEDGETTMSPRIDQYAEKMAFVVKDSKNFFWDGETYLPHNKQLFLDTLSKYPDFAVWFGNAIQEKFRENEIFFQAQDEEDEKNSEPGQQ